MTMRFLEVADIQNLVARKFFFADDEKEDEKEPEAEQQDRKGGKTEI